MSSIYFDLDEDLEDQYESKLFELKQFLIGRFPVRKLFESKLARFQKVEEEFIALGGEVEVVKCDFTPKSFSKVLSEAFAEFHVSAGDMKGLIMQSENYKQLSCVIDVYLKTVQNYASVWRSGVEDLNGVRVSVEPDPMVLQDELKTFESNGYSSIEDVIQDNVSEVIRTESKRLSLWLKLEENEG